MAASQCLSRPPTKIGLFETEVVKRTLFSSGVTIGGEELELMRAASALPSMQLWRRKKDDVPQVGVGNDTITRATVSF